MGISVEEFDIGLSLVRLISRKVKSRGDGYFHLYWAEV